MGVGGTPEATPQLDVVTAGAAPTTILQIRGNRNTYGNVRTRIETVVGGSQTTDFTYIGNDSSATATRGIALRGDGKVTFAGNVSGSSTSTGSFGALGVGIDKPTFYGGGGGLHINNPTSARLHLTDSDGGTGAADGVYVAAIGTEGYFYNFENDALIFGTNTAERMRILAGGDVVFGVTSQKISGSSSSTGSFGEMYVRGYLDVGGKAASTNFGTDANQPLRIQTPSSEITSIAFQQDGTLKGYVAYEDRASNKGLTIACATDNSANGIRFSTGGASYSERMYINNDGKVGIGTNNPSDLLHVYGTSGNIYGIIQATGANQAAGLYLIGHSGDQSRLYFGDEGSSNIGRVVYHHDDNSMRFTTNSSEAMMINTTGNVGIGNSNPIYGKLTVDNTTSGDHVARLSQQMPSTAMYIEMLTGNAPALVINDVGASGSNAGYVSLGAGNTPDAHLHISSSKQIVGSSTASLHIEGSGSEVVAVDGTHGRLFSVTDEMSGSIFSANTVAGIPVIEAKSNYDVLLDPFGNGKVGIGVTDPDQALEVNGRIHIDRAGGYPSLYFSSAASAAWTPYVWFETDSGTLQLGTSSAGTGINIASDGDVGIGTTAPAQKFQVTDGSTNRFYVATNGDINMPAMYNNNIGGDTFRDFKIRNDGLLGVDTSSERYKKNIKDLSNINWIFKLRPVDFEWKSTDKKDWGLVAEEVQEIKPELVTYDEEGRPETVLYSKLTPILLKAVQELSEKVEDLQNEINELKGS
jgi:hypothetical protein